MRKLPFSSDYLESAHPVVLEALTRTAGTAFDGYGTDVLCERAHELIREACGAPSAEIHFLTGGTQANATMVDVLLAPYEGVMAADTGHISTHEAGAIEAGGHKVIALPSRDGKLDAGQLESFFARFESDQNRDHEVWPGLVYVSQPTEFGTLYSLEELTSISGVAHSHGARLYVDGARLAYALASPQGNVGLEDLARLADAFYIGGTKCGALFGEAVVVPQPGLVPHLFTLIKQHGALLAKGWALGAQFCALMQDGLYLRLGDAAVQEAHRIAEALDDRGMLAMPAQTNQVFALLDDDAFRRICERANVSFWDKPDASHTVVRIATSWSTQAGDVDELISVIRGL